MPKFNVPLYLRDLSSGIRAEVEKTLRDTRPDLLELLNKGDDIEIGELFEVKDCKKA